MRQTLHVVSSIVLSSGIAAQCEGEKFNLISPDHWPDFKIVHNNYPSLAGIAGVKGQVILAVAIKTDGSIQQIQAISGPPPLRPYAESLFKDRIFSNLPTKTPGPWIFFASADFRINMKIVVVTPTKREQIPPPPSQK